MSTYDRARAAAELEADRRRWAADHHARGLTEAQIGYLLSYYREHSGNDWPPDWSAQR